VKRGEGAQRAQAIDDLELCLGASVSLRLVEVLLGHLFGKDGGWLRALEDAVLADVEEGFEKVVTDREAHQQLLPGEERAVQGLGEALLVCISLCVEGQ
jgi:hypothetical protein